MNASPEPGWATTATTRPSASGLTEPPTRPSSADPSRCAPARPLRRPRTARAPLHGHAHVARAAPQPELVVRKPGADAEPGQQHLMPAAARTAGEAEKARGEQQYEARNEVMYVKPAARLGARRPPRHARA